MNNDASFTHSEYLARFVAVMVVEWVPTVTPVAMINYVANLALYRSKNVIVSN